MVAKILFILFLLHINVNADVVIVQKTTDSCRRKLSQTMKIDQLLNTRVYTPKCSVANLDFVKF